MMNKKTMACGRLDSQMKFCEVLSYQSILFCILSSYTF